MKTKELNIRRLLTSSVLVASLLMPDWSVSAVELPTLQELAEQQASPAVAIEVVEPHESDLHSEKRVTYRGFPMERILTQLFGTRWRSPDAEVIFFTRDGYRSAIPSQRFGAYRAYLAFARHDGRPFLVDNPRQNEKTVALGPYYLVWDNRDNPSLRQAADYGWPYQVTRIELASSSSYQAIEPPNPSGEVEEGLEHFKQYCLSCHRIGGVGGEKYPADLRQRLCNLNEIDMKTWIEDPRRMRSGGNTMPPLNIMLPERQRSQIADRIVLYLTALEAENPVCGSGTR